MWRNSIAINKILTSGASDIILGISNFSRFDLIPCIPSVFTTACKNLPQYLFRFWSKLKEVIKLWNTWMISLSSQSLL